MDSLQSYPNYPLLNYGNYQTSNYHYGGNFPVEPLKQTSDTTSLGPPRTANSNLDGLGKFLDWNDVMRERCIELIILKIDHLLEDTLSGHIPLELYNVDSRSTIDKVLHLWHEKDYEKFDKIKQLSYQWCKRVREEETRHRSANQLAEGCTGWEKAQDGKKINKTQEEIKQEVHWECSGCLRVFPRNNSCNKHVKTCKSSGNAKAVRKPGQIFATSLQSLGTHQNANSMPVLNSSGHPGTPDLFTACLAEVDSNVSGNVFEAVKKQVQNPVYPFEQDNSALIWKL
eukprot:GFUD01035571.1.p1 GENE.GFUD01035571.1~~GFUD01035571.1.p1  ORF type:complete len:285 (-),score=28.75 GFUD01035571.1:244-1098(-)